MHSGRFAFTLWVILFFTIFPYIQSQTGNEVHERIFKSSSPFSTALETLQKQIGYPFQNLSLLRRAMTHASFSEENNRALSILGVNVIETSVSLRLLGNDIDISSKELNRRLAEISKVESSCTSNGMQLGLQKVVRISPKTNSSTPAVVCGAFRAIFGAIAIDVGKLDAAGNIFWKVHGGDVGFCMVS
ncbi:protein NUCLEAR FUSION DEFECTIVE 2 isoform X2 [Fagus crenata]